MKELLSVIVLLLIQRDDSNSHHSGGMSHCFRLFRVSYYIVDERIVNFYCSSLWSRRLISTFINPGEFLIFGSCFVFVMAE